MGARYFGAAVRRREDPRFLRGEARYVDDVTLPGMLHAAFLRAPHAHARLARIDTVAAKALAGVAAVFTFDDLARWMKPLPLFGAPPHARAAAITFDVRQASQWALCRDRARYVGEAVAMVVAEGRACAEDAVHRIAVAWEALPPVVDVAEAVAPGSPLVHPEWGTNVAIAFTHSIGDPDVAFARADVVVSETLRIQRYVGMPLECRGVVAHWGRPETVFAMDRILDRLGRELTMDPAELRRKNYIRADELPYDLGMPYRDGNPLVYDTGDFPAVLEQALAAAGYDAFRREQARLRARGVYRGIGISGYVEGTAIGPFEGATVKLDLHARVVVATGAVNSGQGHETSFAQVAADALGVPLDWVTVTGGDTAAVPFGVGTFASRSAVTAGSSIADACHQIRTKLVRAAATLLEAAPEDVEIDDGRAFVRGSPQKALDLARVVQASIPTFAAPGVASPDFEATAYHHVPTVTYASAVHVAQVDVDVGTGHVTLLRYVVAHDCGKVINPLIVDGQVHGGVAQGVGGALYEEMVYDEQGQLLTGSLMDY